MGEENLRMENIRVDELVGVCMFYGYNGSCDSPCESSKGGKCRKYDNEILIPANNGHFSHFYIRNIYFE